MLEYLSLNKLESLIQLAGEYPKQQDRKFKGCLPIAQKEIFKGVHSNKI